MSTVDPPESTIQVSPSNLAWVEELYYAYRRDPASVEEAWRREFDRLDHGSASPLWGNGNAASGNGQGHVPAMVSAGAREIAAVAAQRALGGKRVRRLIEDY